MDYLSNSSKKKLIENLCFSFNIDKKDTLTKKKMKDKVIYFLNFRPFAIEFEKVVFPHLKFLDENSIYLKKIYVDNGAVSFMLKGADLLRPGIIKLDDDIQKDELVLVVNNKFPKALCICRVNYSSNEIRKFEKGKVAKNMHFLKDEIYGF